MRFRTDLVMLLLSVLVFSMLIPIGSRADQTCRDCHPMGLIQAGVYEKIPDSWSIGDLVSSGYDSPCPGLEEIAAQVDLTDRTRSRLDLLFQNREPEDEAEAGLHLVLEALVWRWRHMIQQPPRSARYFAGQAAQLRDDMDKKVFIPIFKRDMDQRVRLGAAILLAVLSMTAFLWLYRRLRLKSYER